MLGLTWTEGFKFQEVQDEYSTILRNQVANQLYKISL